MSWNPKKWWKVVVIATIALQLLCLAISPNPLSIMLIPVGMALFGGAAPVGYWGIQKALDPSKDGLGRGLGVFQALFCLGLTWSGIKLVWAAIAVAIAIWRMP